MRHSKFLALALTALMAVGCFDSKIDECTLATNLTINFSSKEVDQNEAFLEKINNVELFIYTLNGQMVERHSLTREQLVDFAGVQTLLAPDTYVIVAYANATTARTVIVTDQLVHYSDRLRNYVLTAASRSGITQDGDPLYYSPRLADFPKRVVVPAEGTATITSEFYHAHIKLEIFVEGYQNATRAASDPITVELAKLTSRYSFMLDPYGDQVSYIKSAPNTDLSTNTYRTMFNVPLFDNSAQTQIIIRNKAGQQIVRTIVLTELLGGVIDLTKVEHIPIIIKFSKDGLSVVDITVNLPEWIEANVIPET